MIVNPNKLRGYTLVELLIALSVTAIVFTFCTIQFGPVIKRQMNYYQINRVKDLIYYARRAAPALGQELTLCLGNKYGCNNTQLQWILWADNNQDSIINDNERLQQVLALKGAFISQNRGQFRFKADGSIWPNGAIIVCSDDDLGPSAKVTLLYTGKVRYLQDDNNAILCRKN